MSGDARLNGVRVLLTRPKDRVQELQFLLEDEGAEVLALPMLELVPPDDTRPLESAVEHVHRYRWVLFTSPAAVHALVEAARQAGSIDRLRKVRIGVVGPQTALACQSLQLPVAVEAAQRTGEGLYEAIRQELDASDEVLLPAAQEGRRELKETLEEHGVQVTWVAAYRSESRPLEPAILFALRDRPADVIVFASPRTAEAFLESTQAEGAEWVRRAKLVAIGPTTARGLDALGLTAAAVAEEPTPSGLVEAVVRAVGASR